MKMREQFNGRMSASQAEHAGSIPVSRSTRLSLDAIRVPGSAFYFVSSLAFMVGYLFVNASQGVGDEIVVTQIVLVFIWVSGLFRVGFSKPPYLDVQPPKEQKQQKTAFLIKIGKRFCHFLDTGREMIFDGPTGLSWELTREGGNRLWPGAVPPLARGEGKISKCFYIS